MISILNFLFIIFYFFRWWIVVLKKKKAREEMAHKSQSIDTDEFETGIYNIIKLKIY